MAGTYFPEEEKNTEGLDMFPEGGSVENLPEDVLEQRVQKANYGLGNESPGVDTLRTEFQVGKEDNRRQLQVNYKLLQEQEDRAVILRELVNSGAEHTPELQAFVETLSSQQLANPKTVLEEAYSKKLIDDAMGVREGYDTMSENMDQYPSVHEEAMSIGQMILTNKELAQRRVEELSSKYEQQGWGAWAWDVAETMVPFRASVYNLERDAVEDAPTSTLLPGQNIEEQRQYLYLLPPDEFEQKFNAAVDEIESRNLHEALSFAHHILRFSASDKLWKNAELGLDIIDLATIGGVGIKAIGKKAVKNVTENALERKTAEEAAGESVTAAKQVVQSASKEKVKPSEVASAAGEIEGAAKQAFVERAVVQSGRKKAPSEVLTEIEEAVPTFADPSHWLKGGKLSNELTDRLIDAFTISRDTAYKALMDLPMVQRLTAPELAKAIEYTMEQFGKQYTRLEDRVIAVTPMTPIENRLENVGKLQILLGNKDAKLFNTKRQAQTVAQLTYRLPKGSYDLVRQGRKWGISIEKNIDETAPVIKTMGVETEYKTPTRLSSLIGWTLGQDVVTSPVSAAERKLVQSTRNRLTALARELGEPIAQLNKTQKKRLNQLLDINRRTPVLNKATQETEYGRFYENISDWEESYLKEFNELPTPEETRAYYAAMHINDLDYVVNNLSIWRDKAVKGIERHSFRFKMPDGSKLDTDFVEGKFIGNQIPWSGRYSDNILAYDETTGQMKLVNKLSASEDERKWLDELVGEKNHKVWQISEYDQKYLQKATGQTDSIHYVVARTTKTKPLSGKQLPYRPGGHFMYKTPYAVKQARVRKANRGTVYEGDTAIFGATTSAEAKKYSEALEVARMLLKNEDTNFSQFVSNNLPFDPKELKKMFLSGQLDLNSPISWVNQYGETLAESMGLKNKYPDFINELEAPTRLMRDIDLMYATERNAPLHMVRESGSAYNPIMRLDMAPMLEPMDAMDRALGRLFNRHVMEPFKEKHIRKWVEEFGPYMDIPIDRIRNNPLKYLYNPRFVESLWQTKPEIASAAYNSRRAILNTIGYRDRTRRAVDYIANKVADSVYTSFGQKKAEVLSPMLMYSTRDPAALLRGFAFHSKLGLFNPIQIFIQSQSWTNVLAWAERPVRDVLPGSYAAWAMRALDINNLEQHIDKVASMSKKFGWKPDEFKEMFNAYESSGWGIVGREAIQRNDLVGEKIFQTKAAFWLDKGTFFFTEMESAVRRTAWAVAYREWKSKNPYKKVDDLATRDILNRADFLAVNMTSASQAGWQQGVTSIPTQFFGYQARLFEQFVDMKRTTVPQKLRAMATYAAMYGVPVTASAVGFGVPWHEDIKQEYFKRGQNIPEGAFGFLMTGIQDTALKTILGEDYNVSERWGPSGLQAFKDIFSDETPAWELLVGVSGTVVGDVFRNSYPAAMALVDTVTGTPEDEAMPLQVSDFIDAFRNVTTVNNVIKATIMMNTSRYITARENYIDDVDTIDAFVYAFMGLEKQDISDSWLKIDIAKGERNNSDWFKQEYIKNIRRAAREDDPEVRMRHLKAARAMFIASGAMPDMAGRWISEAVRSNTTLMEGFDFDFSTGNIERFRRSKYGDQK